MRTDSGTEPSGHAASLDVVDASPYSAAEDDPIANAVSRGDDPLAMFANSPVAPGQSAVPIEDSSEGRVGESPATAADEPAPSEAVSPAVQPAVPTEVQALSPAASENRPALFSTPENRPGVFSGDAEEPVPGPAPAVAPRESSHSRHLLKSRAVFVVAFLIVAVAAVAFGAWRLLRGTGSPPAPVAAVPQQGRLTVDSRPAGAQVEIDGVVRGTTPLELRMKAGLHVMRVGGPGGHEIDVVVTAGGVVAHHVELPDARARLHVDSVPSAAMVTVDGVVRGPAPLDLDDLQPGTHAVAVAARGATVRRDVDLRAGTLNSVVLSIGGGPATGWLTVAAPFDVDVYEDGRLVGRGRDGRMLLVSGPHDLTLTNGELGYSEVSRVEVAAGKTANVRVQPRNGQLSVNAIPWAEVFVDGNRIGETPIANHAATIGRHEVVLRHPQLGEQRRTVVVTLTSPARVGVTFK